MTDLADRVDSFRQYWKMDVPQFGQPRKGMPPMTKPIQPKYWQIVAQHAQANPGEWIPLEKPPLSPIRLQNIAWALRSGSTPNIPIPMRVPGMQGRWFRKRFYFRYDPPEDES